jgi:hypothetical protein
VRAPFSHGAAELTRETDYQLAGLDLSAAMTFGARLTVEAQLPLRLMDRRSRFLDPGGDPTEGVQAPDLQDGRALGLADPTIGARWRLLGGGGGEVVVDARGGLSLPIGRALTGPAPADPAQGTAPLFFGTGTFDPLVGVDVVRAVGRWRVVAWASARFGLARGPAGGRGLRVAGGGFGGDRALLGGKIRVGGTFSGFREPLAAGAAAGLHAFWLPSAGTQVVLGVDRPLLIEGDRASVENAILVRLGIVRQIGIF